MPRYRKRPVVVDAEQWHPGRQVKGVIEGLYWEAGGAPVPARVQTLEGWLGVRPGDWIITGVEGERYPCKPRIFEATYEPVTEE